MGGKKSSARKLLIASMLALMQCKMGRYGRGDGRTRDGWVSIWYRRCIIASQQLYCVIQEERWGNGGVVRPNECECNGRRVLMGSVSCEMQDLESREQRISKLGDGRSFHRCSCHLGRRFVVKEQCISRFGLGAPSLLYTYPRYHHSNPDDPPLGLGISKSHSFPFEA